MRRRILRDYHRRDNMGRYYLFLVVFIMRVKFYIVCTGWNCAQYVRGCFDSIVTQSEKNFEAIMISDGSTDKTAAELKKIEHADSRVKIRLSKSNEGAAFQRFHAIHSANLSDDDVILLLGMDDKLFPHSLERIAREYDKGKFMTFGNWVNQFGKMLPRGFLHFDAITHQRRAYRLDTYRSTAPNTFKKFLFDRIPEDDFKINGKWIQTTTESELMFSCLEMSGRHRIGVIEDAIYFYRESLPTGTLRRLGVKYKYDILNIIRQRPKKQLIT